MNKLVQIGPDTFWRESADQLIQIPSADGLTIMPAGSVGAELLAAPGFLEFISAADAQLVELYFAKDAVYLSDQFLWVRYSSTLMDYYIANIVIDVATGAQLIRPRFTLTRTYYSLAEFKNNNREYFELCELMRASDTRAEKLQAEVAQLRAENLELRLRPGGPDYEAARERFESGDYHA